jgi:hypothetical protein
MIMLFRQFPAMRAFDHRRPHTSFPGRLPRRAVHSDRRERALGLRPEERFEELRGCTSCPRLPRGTTHSCLLDLGSTLIGVSLHNPRESDNRMRIQPRAQADACPDLKQSGGEPWSFSVLGESLSRAQPTFRAVVREAQATRPESDRIRVGLTGFP